MDFICSLCNKEFKSLQALNGHKASCGKQKVECPYCHEKFLYSNIKRHMEICKIDNYCKYCGKKISYNKKFCDNSCSAKFYNKNRKRKQICINCGKQFYRERLQKFCSNKCSSEYHVKLNDIEFLKGNIISQSSLKTHLKIHKDYKCEICGIEGMWNGKPLVLILDHINGNPEDNRYENLRFVCPNCNSQLPTFTGRNKKGNGRYYRRKRYREGKSY